MKSECCNIDIKEKQYFKIELSLQKSLFRKSHLVWINVFYLRLDIAMLQFITDRCNAALLLYFSLFVVG